MGILGDAHGLYPRLTARENIVYYGRLQGMEAGAAQARAQELARMLDMEGIPYMALDLDPDRVRKAAAAGDSVVFGDAARVQALIAAGKGYMGVTGDKTFDENGDVGAVYGRWTVKQQAIQDYK